MVQEHEVGRGCVGPEIAPDGGPMLPREPVRAGRRGFRLFAWLWLLLGSPIASDVALAAETPSAQTSGRREAALHVPSPDWRDQVIYFLMTDRFDNGDPANDDQDAGEFDPADGAKYNGGDLRGVERRLDYIRGLGATAVWITPPVANQWWNPVANYAGYHGYWAENFRQVDPHLGTWPTTSGCRMRCTAPACTWCRTSCSTTPATTSTTTARGAPTIRWPTSS